jgi:hypothetical protein
MPSLYKAKMGGRVAHTIRKFLGQDLGPGTGAAPLGRDFEQVRSKGNGSGPHSNKLASRVLATIIEWDSMGRKKHLHIR